MRSTLEWLLLIMDSIAVVAVVVDSHFDKLLRKMLLLYGDVDGGHWVPTAFG